ncbi:MAG: hypothetical protein JXO22_11640 [Phycisphaerae bacterium]|nr:hypothetical protein [Phycisphaerae bacterium]
MTTASDQGRARSGATRKAATQAAILRATEDLVREVRAQKGSAMFITVKQIARRANVAVSSIYNHFPAGVGAIALQLADNAKVSNRPLDPEVQALARAEQARMMASSDAEAKVRAELHFMWRRSDAARARELVAEADNDGSSAELRFLCRVALAETLDDNLPVTRDEVIAITQQAEALAAEHGLHHVQRQAMRDTHATALLTPVDDLVADAHVEEAIRLLREGASFIRKHQISMTRDGWLIDALSREFIAEVVSCRDIKDEDELRQMFEGWVSKFVQAVTTQDDTRVERPDTMFLADLVNIVLTVEAVGLFRPQVAADCLEQLEQHRAVLRSQDPDEYDYSYQSATFAAEVLHGKRCDFHEIPLNDLAKLSLKGLTCTHLAAMRLGMAADVDSLIKSLTVGPRDLSNVAWEYVRPDIAMFDCTEVRNRLVKIFSASPRRAEGHTNFSLEHLFALEAATRQAIRTGQPFEPAVKERINAIWNNIT